MTLPDPARVSRPAATSATRARIRFADRFASWRDLHLYSFVSSIGRLAQRPWGSLLTVGVMAVALALPVCLGMMLRNLEAVSGGFRDARDFSLFLLPGIKESEVETVRAAVTGMSGVGSVELRTPDQGLAEFTEMSDLGGALALLDYNPLPAVLVVEPTAGDVSQLVERMSGLPGVDFVQHDAEWRTRLEAWLGFGRRMTALVAVLLGVGVLLVVGNTVRLDIQARAEEIETVQLLGATDGFVRRPFLYLGACYGALAGAIAIAIATGARIALQEPVSALVASYGSEFQLAGLGWNEAGLVLGVSVALGWLGAWLAAGHHLRQSLPGARR